MLGGGAGYLDHVALRLFEQLRAKARMLLFGRLELVDETTEKLRGRERSRPG